MPKRAKKPPIAIASGGAASKSLAASMASVNSWREQYNPLVGLVMQRARQLLELGQRGEFADLQWTYKFIEERFPTLFGLVERRTSAIVELDWDIRQTPEDDLPQGATPAMAEAQAAYLREVYDRIDNLTDALEHLALATFRGYAHVQKQDADGDGEVDHLEILDQWNFVRAGLCGDWFWNPDAKQTNWQSLITNRIDPDAFIIREVKRPVNPIALYAFIRYAMGMKDWSGFIDIFGIPGGVVIGPANVPPEKEAEYKSAGREIAEGGSGYLPNGSDFKFNDSPRGVNPFRDYMRAQTEDVVLAGTGGLLTMLTESGSGTLAGNAHADTFNKIARAESRKISSLFNRQMDDELLDSKFPGQPHLAYFALGGEENIPSEVIDDIAKLSTAGYVVDPDEVAERTSYPVTIKAPSAAPLNRLESPAPASGDAQGDVSTDPHSSAASAASTGEVQSTALNGAQVQALADLASQVALGALPAKTARSIAAAAFPLISPAILDSIFTPLASFTPRAEPPADAAPITNRDIQGDNPTAAVSRAISQDMQPIIARLAAIADITDDAIFERKLREFYLDFPQLQVDVLKDPSADRALLPILTQSFIAGMKKGQPAK